MSKPLALLALMLLAGCQQRVKCDISGHIVIPPLASERERSQMAAANNELDNRRIQSTLGSGADFQTRAGLEKAEGCP